MIPRQHPLAGPAILFASGGARGHADENTVEAFHLARRLGATGIESEVLLTADGVPVLRRDARIGGLRRRRVTDLDAADLPPEVVTLQRFYDEIGTDVQLLLHAPSTEAADAALAVTTRHRALDGLWLAAPSRPLLAAWRERSTAARLIDSTPVRNMATGAERHAAELRELRVDAVLLSQSEWSGGRTALFHRFGLRCFGTDAPHERMITALLHIGLDGVVSAYPDRMVDAAAAIARPDAPDFLDG